MIFRWSLTKNLVNAELLGRLRVAKSPVIMRVMCEVVRQEAKRAWYDKHLRPSAWAPKVDGTEATLMYQQVLRRSPKVISATPTRGQVGSDRKYAAIHQLGGVIRRTSPKGRAFVIRIKARPYFPFRANGQPTLSVKGKMERAAEIRLANGRY